MNSVFAARLTKLRRERGMSQKDAAKMPVSYTHLTLPTNREV